MARTTPDSDRPSGDGEQLELETPGFEDAMRELEGLVDAMEDGSLSLDASIKSFERGMKLVEQCARELRGAEDRVKALTEEAGRLRLTDFEPERDGE